MSDPPMTPSGSDELSPYSRPSSSHDVHPTPPSHSFAAGTTSVSTPSPSVPRTARASRKQRGQIIPADYLLNFATYNPPPPSSQFSQARNSSKRALTRVVPRPREQFVQANYRFLVDPTDESVAPCRTFPDALVPWHAVDVVFLPHRPDCPICLHPLRGPRVTPCGHVFDTVCILQHVAYAVAEDKLPRCPLCADRIQPGLLKPCVFANSPVPSVGDTLSFRLVSRKRGSMLCHPHQSPPHSDSVPFVVNHAATFYSRIAFAKHSLLMRIITRFKRELADVASEDPNLIPFVSAAVGQLDTWANSIRTRRRVSLSDAPTSLQDSVPASTSAMPKIADATVISRDENGIAGIKVTDSLPELSKNESIKTNNNGGKIKERWYFYQEESSSNVFLHPMNHRALSAEYAGDFDRALRSLEGVILQIDAFTMNETLRKRYRFLDHLPDGCEFMFVELDLTHVLSEHALAAHASEIKERHCARNKKRAALAEETRRLEREQSQSLLKYFNTHGGIVGSMVRSVPVDRNDRASFPALRERSSSNPSDNSYDVRDGAGSTEDLSGATSGTVSGSPPKAAGIGWGSDISSYSSVTSKMGLFPTLGSSPRSVETLQGPWGSSSQSNVGARSQPQKKNGASSGSEESRKGRKSQTKTILMSNAGSSHRR